MQPKSINFAPNLFKINHFSFSRQWKPRGDRTDNNEGWLHDRDRANKKKNIVLEFTGKLDKEGRSIHEIAMHNAVFYPDKFNEETCPFSTQTCFYPEPVFIEPKQRSELLKELLQIEDGGFPNAKGEQPIHFLFDHVGPESRSKFVESMDRRHAWDGLGLGCWFSSRIWCRSNDEYFHDFKDADSSALRCLKALIEDARDKCPVGVDGEAFDKTKYYIPHGIDALDKDSLLATNIKKEQEDECVRKRVNAQTNAGDTPAHVLFRHPDFDPRLPGNVDDPTVNGPALRGNRNAHGERAAMARSRAHGDASIVTELTARGADLKGIKNGTNGQGQGQSAMELLNARLEREGAERAREERETYQLLFH